MNEPTTIPHEAEVPSVARYTATPGLPAPVGHGFASLCWLVARHPGLVEVAARVPGAVDTDGDVMPWVLAAAISDLDEYRAARLAHDLARPLPAAGQTSEEYAARLSGWAAEAPTPDPSLAAVQDLSGAELGQLRLLATFNQSGVRFSTGMLDGFDPGHTLLRDWLTAVHHLHNLPTTTNTTATAATAATATVNGAAAGASAGPVEALDGTTGTTPDATHDVQLDPAVQVDRAVQVDDMRGESARVDAVGVDRQWWRDQPGIGAGGVEAGWTRDGVAADVDAGWSS